MLGLSDLARTRPGVRNSNALNVNEKASTRQDFIGAIFSMFWLPQVGLNNAETNGDASLSRRQSIVNAFPAAFPAAQPLVLGAMAGRIRPRCPRERVGLRQIAGGKEHATPRKESHAPVWKHSLIAPRVVLSAAWVNDFSRALRCSGSCVPALSADRDPESRRDVTDYCSVLGAAGFARGSVPGGAVRSSPSGPQIMRGLVPRTWLNGIPPSLRRRLLMQRNPAAGSFPMPNITRVGSWPFSLRPALPAVPLASASSCFPRRGVMPPASPSNCPQKSVSIGVHLWLTLLSSLRRSSPSAFSILPFSFPHRPWDMTSRPSPPRQ